MYTSCWYRYVTGQVQYHAGFLMVIPFGKFHILPARCGMGMVTKDARLHRLVVVPLQNPLVIEPADSKPEAYTNSSVRTRSPLSLYNIIPEHMEA